MITGGNGVAVFSTEPPFCRSVLHPSDRLSYESLGLIRFAGGQLLGAADEILYVNSVGGCGYKTSTRLELSSASESGRIGCGYVFLDNYTGEMLLFRR